MTQHNLFAGLIMLKQQIATPGAREGGRDCEPLEFMFVLPYEWVMKPQSTYIQIGIIKVPMGEGAATDFDCD